MRNLSILILFVTACSASQKTEEKQLAVCTGAEASQITAILHGSDSDETKVIELAVISKEIYDCAKAQATAAKGSGSGSAK